MRAARRTTALALLLTLTALTAPMAASSQTPTLGMRVSSEVYGDSPSPALLLTSRATAPTRVALALPEGWTLATTTLEMAPGQEMSLPFLTVGAPATMTTTQTLLDPQTGGTQGALEVATKLLSTRPAPPMDWTPFALTTVLVLLLAIAGLATLRWLSRNVQVSRR